MPRLRRGPWRPLSLLVISALLVLPLFLVGHLHADDVPVSPTCATCKAVHPEGVESSVAPVVAIASAVMATVFDPAETITDEALRSTSSARGPPTSRARTN